MSTTQIPPRTNSTPNPPESADLYDARYWESAYRESFEAPTLLIQLQDDLTRSRRREAFWISVVVHLIVVLLIVNSDKLMRFLPHGTTVMVHPMPMASDKDTTFLELPPDEQKVTKRPDTNIISDKDRIATTKTPQLNREELKKILDASRRGAPGPTGQPSPQPSPAPQTAQQAAPTQQQQAQAGQPAPAPPAPRQNPNLTAKLQSPPVGAKNPFAMGPSYAGSATEQAAAAVAAGRGQHVGDDGDYGLGQGNQGKNVGALDILSDTMGVDFGPYLQRVLHDVKVNWYNLIPESARPPIMKKGKVAIEFAILKDGTIAGMKLEQGGSSGDPALDRAAWGGITGSNPFPPLPSEFKGQYLALRFHFFYNPDKGDLQ